MLNLATVFDSAVIGVKFSYLFVVSDCIDSGSDEKGECVVMNMWKDVMLKKQPELATGFPFLS